MVFFITTALLIGYGINLLVFVRQIIVSDDPNKRTIGLISILVTTLSAIGVIYLAAH